MTFGNIVIDWLNENMTHYGPWSIEGWYSNSVVYVEHLMSRHLWDVGEISDNVPWPHVSIRLRTPHFRVMTIYAAEPDLFTTLRNCIEEFAQDHELYKARLEQGIPFPC